jgi:hypothetical protein
MWFDLPGLKWSPPLRIVEQWAPDCTPGSGCYLLVASAQDGGIASIQRVCGVDASGTLYIGRAGSIEWRVNELRKTLRPAEYVGAHGAGLLLRNIQIFREAFPVQNLAVQWALCEEPGETEARLIDTYVRHFGEGPPLNRQRSVPSYD